MIPSYIEALKNGTLVQKAEKALTYLARCTLCPRRCGVDRTRGDTGVCQTGRFAKVASYDSHFGEESPLVGQNGSGTIFFSNCSLLCNFCQNYDISHEGQGTVLKDEQVAAIMLELQRAGCHNINFVTPSHVVPQILSAVCIAAQQGLEIPLVYNSSGYDNVETLHLMNGIVDIYMPDFKFWDASVAKRTCGAPDYPQIARSALLEMHRQVEDLVVDEASGLAYKGLLVRHLVLPADMAGTAQVMQFISEHVSTDTYVNVMAQYRPCGKANDIDELAVHLSSEDYNRALQETFAAGLSRLDRPRRVFEFR